MVAEALTQAVEDSTEVVVAEAMRAVGEAGAIRTAAEAPTAEVIAAVDPCLDTAARLAEAGGMRAALMVAHPTGRVASVEAGRVQLLLQTSTLAPLAQTGVSAELQSRHRCPEAQIQHRVNGIRLVPHQIMRGLLELIM